MPTRPGQANPLSRWVRGLAAWVVPRAAAKAAAVPPSVSERRPGAPISSLPPKMVGFSSCLVIGPFRWRSAPPETCQGWLNNG